MSYILYIFFGILPSIIWLLFYLRKDSHPESNRMILKIFCYGALITLPAVFLEKGALIFLERLNLPFGLMVFLKIFVGVALVEEFLKYLVVRKKVLKDAEFDEPVDVLIYMIIAALGFAAAENVLILFSLSPKFLFEEVFMLSILRFWGATFLHALCSGTLGYFLALSIFETKKRKALLITGLAIATLLHGFYNFLIMKLSENIQLLLPGLALVLIGLALFLAFAFKKLKKLKSVCKIQ